jgi:hypothetical protein
MSIFNVAIAIHIAPRNQLADIRRGLLKIRRKAE